MKPTEANRFKKLYQRHLRLLKLQGKSQKTIDAYSRAVRRVRDYGFLHGNAKKLLFLVQLILHVGIQAIEHRPRPVFKCPCCKSPMIILGFRQTAWKPG